MDGNDVRIFCSLAISGPPDALAATSPRGIRRVARGLGLDEKTVRLRLRRMEAEGFIKYYQATPDLALLGVGAEVTCRFEAVNLPTKTAALRAAQQESGMVEALDFVGPSFTLTIGGPTITDAFGSQQRLARRFELELYVQGRRELPVSSARMSPLDWRIVERIRYDARAPIREVAASVGITARMAGYRLARLRESGALTLRPMVDARRLRGLLMYRLAIVVDPAARERVLGELRRRLGSALWAIRVSLAGPLLLDMFAPSLLDPEETALDALRVEGVQAVRVLLLKEILEPDHGGWVDRAIGERASGSPPYAAESPATRRGSVRAARPRRS